MPNENDFDALRASLKALASDLHSLQEAFSKQPAGSPTSQWGGGSRGISISSPALALAGRVSVLEESLPPVIQCLEEASAAWSDTADLSTARKSLGECHRGLNRLHREFLLNIASYDLVRSMFALSGDSGGESSSWGAGIRSGLGKCQIMFVSLSESFATGWSALAEQLSEASPPGLETREFQSLITARAEAQASLLSLAQTVWEHSEPLILGLKALVSSPSRPELETMWTAIEDDLRGLVNELGCPGGPKVDKVDAVFDLLLGKHSIPGPEVPLGGQLGKVAQAAGLIPGSTQAPFDESAAPSFQILVDYVNSVLQAWNQQRQVFVVLAAPAPKMGNQRALLSQVFATLSEHIHQARSALEAQGMGRDERENTILTLSGERAPITIEELLGWVDDFATGEGPRLLHEGSKESVAQIRAAINRLAYLIFLSDQFVKSALKKTSSPFLNQHLLEVLDRLLSAVRQAVMDANKH